MKAVLFDMDGVLIDTERVWLNAVKTVFHEHNITLDEVDLLRVRGSSGSIIIPELCKKYELSNHQQIRQAASSLFIDQWEENSAMLPGVQEAIQAAKLIGPIGIVTNSNQELLDAFLAKTELRPEFAVAISGKTVGHFKPDPQIYKIACARINCSPKDVLVFEDSNAGMTAAIGAGCNVVAVGTHGSQFSVLYRITDISEAATYLTTMSFHK